MRDADSALNRLKAHSGLPLAVGDIPTDTLAEFLFQCVRGATTPDLDRVTEDIISCLEVWNEKLNPPIDDRPAEAPSPLAYAVSGIVAGCLNTVLELRQSNRDSPLADRLLGVAWHVQTAWDSLLAGDIENLADHVEGEWRGRFGATLISENK